MTTTIDLAVITAANEDIGEHDVCPMTGSESCPSDQKLIDKCRSC